MTLEMSRCAPGFHIIDDGSSPGFPYRCWACGREWRRYPTGAEKHWQAFRRQVELARGSDAGGPLDETPDEA